MLTLVHYLFPALAVIFLILAITAHNPIRRRALTRTGIIFGLVAIFVWWRR